MVHPILEFFHVIEKKSGSHFVVSCKKCNQRFTSTSSRLVYHIAGLPGHGIRQCPVPLSATESAKVEVILANRKGAPPIQTVQLVTTSAQTLAQIADDKWAHFFYAEAIALRKADSLWFREALSASIAAGVSYQPPNRRNLAHELLDSAVVTVKQTIDLNIMNNIAVTGMVRNVGFTDSELL
jgi:hypothetical protein